MYVSNTGMMGGGSYGSSYSYGGQGGWGKECSACSEPANAYGNPCFPYLAGSGSGPTGIGGSGGGVVQMLASIRLEYDGDITSSGSGGADSGGGGSGGAVWLEADYLEGHGSTTASGGSGSSLYHTYACDEYGGGGGVAVVAATAHSHNHNQGCN